LSNKYPRPRSAGKFSITPWKDSYRAHKKLRAGLSSGPSGDEVYTPSPRRSEGQCGQLGGTLFAPHCEQNLYANPKRTAKSSIRPSIIRYTMLRICSKIFFRLSGLATSLGN